MSQPDLRVLFQLVEEWRVIATTYDVARQHDLAKLVLQFAQELEETVLMLQAGAGGTIS